MVQPCLDTKWSLSYFQCSILVMSLAISGSKFIENEADKLAFLDFKSKISEDPFQAYSFLKQFSSLLQLDRVRIGRLENLGDVYSYGIMLLEMLKDTRPNDVIFKDGPTIHRYSAMAFD
ncbi:uncharacterized protein LOC129901546 [Solanum dulcamara]|uniref:uncharacterized protein LOC129901546 n=1 Tax=Solanum dulcamara TaxID=45834 RepID=UPI00248526A5|nr:uncharacterized protein LOC129901546 [Solanum dulcamara]